MKFKSLILTCLLLLNVSLMAEEKPQAPAIQPISNLDQLLQKIKQQQSNEKNLYKQREQRFLKARDQQKKLLEEARDEFLAAQKKNNPLQKVSDDNEEKLKWMREELGRHVQDLGDIHSIYNEFSGDFIARMTDSLVQTQLNKREPQLSKLSQTETLPDIESMRALWLLLQEEMTEAGKIQQYQANVVQANGQMQSQTVNRIATFSAISNGKMLRYLPQTRELVTVARQPAEYQRYIANFGKANDDGMSWVVIDPTRGSLLGLLGQSPSLKERIMQGKEVGYVIIALAIAGLLIACYRIIYLSLVQVKIRKQLKAPDNPLNTNPLGRVLLVARANEKSDTEALQAKLDEAILKELPALEQGQSQIKLLAAIAPLLGLLGTVIGMIATFQSISLFGSGDPKLMASGISQALVTTVLGLVAAIPLLFCHNIISSFSRGLVQILDEQSVGLIARMLEAKARVSPEEMNHVE